MVCIALYKLPIPAHSLTQYLGDVVRISPNELSFTSIPATKDIYYHQTKTRPAMPKSMSYARPEANPTLFSVRDVNEHSRQKAAFTHAFSPRALKDQEPLILRYCDAWITMLAREATSPAGIDMVTAWNWLTFDIIGDLTMGASFDCIKTAKTHPWIAMLFNSLTFGVIFDLIRRLPPLKFALPFFVPLKQLAENRKRILEYTQEKVAARVRAGEERKVEDFFADLLRKGNYTEEGLISQAYMLTIAGTETSASALSGATYYLSLYPDALATLQSEVRSSFTSPDQITGDSTRPDKLPFTTAVLEEALRLFPPAPSHALRESPGGVTVDGEYIPKGVGVTTQNYPMSRDPRYWWKPNEFHPERWLKGDDCPEEFRSDNKAASNREYHPFMPLRSEVILLFLFLIHKFAHRPQDLIHTNAFFLNSQLFPSVPAPVLESISLTWKCASHWRNSCGISIGS